jgi:hypothetical protein
MLKETDYIYYSYFIGEYAGVQGVIAKAKKLPKQLPEFKAEVDSFEERLLATAVERKEEEATTEVRHRWTPSLTQFILCATEVCNYLTWL